MSVSDPLRKRYARDVVVRDADLYRERHKPRALNRRIGLLSIWSGTVERLASSGAGHTARGMNMTRTRTINRNKKRVRNPDYANTSDTVL